MAQETITQIQSAPDYLKPGIEKFLEGATAQAGQAMDTSKLHRQWWDLEHYNNKHNRKQLHKQG